MNHALANNILSPELFDSYEDLMQLIPPMVSPAQPACQNILNLPDSQPERRCTCVRGATSVNAARLIYQAWCGFTRRWGLTGSNHCRLPSPVRGFDALVRALDVEHGTWKSESNKVFLHPLVSRSVASRQELVATVSEEQRLADRALLITADTVYLIGQLSAAPVVELWRYLLPMRGQRTVRLDESEGLATQMARTTGTDDRLLAMSFRRYAKEVAKVCRQKQEAIGLSIEKRPMKLRGKYYESA